MKGAQTTEEKVRVIAEVMGPSADLPLIRVLVRHYTPPTTDAILAYLLEGCSRESWMEVGRTAGMTAAPLREVSKFQCQICQDDKDAKEIYVVSCKEEHKYCNECLEGHCEARFREGQVSCPGSSCKYHMTAEEVWALIPHRRQEYDAVLLQRELSGRNFTRCSCGYTMELAPPGGRQRCECAKCKRVYCSVCDGEYHMMTCEELDRHRHFWQAWASAGRADYLRKKQGEEQGFVQQQQAYEKEKEQWAKDREISAQNYAILKADESTKAANCRRCPQCRKVVERIAGCSSMKCGENYHGGDKQSGCGATFNWDQAPRYEAEVPDAPTLQQFVKDAPQKAKGVKHGDLQCDQCRSPLVGLRFQCLHCPGINLCEGCDAKGSHPKAHVFKIHTESEPVAG